MILWFAYFGCVSEDLAGTGAVEFSLSGGTAVREGFPHTEGETEMAFVDGWELSFDRYLVSVGELTVGDPETGEALAAPRLHRVVDLARAADASEDLELMEDLPALRADIGFTVEGASAASSSDSASASDLAEMQANGWSHWIGGVAHRDGEEVTFSLGLSLPTRYTRCVNGKDFTRGLAIESHKTTGAVLYAHAVHLFWDTLAAGDEDLRFDAWAAVAGHDALVTPEDLAAQDLTDLRAADGTPLLDADGHRVLYDDGGMLTSNQYNLLAFISEALRQSAHLNGVGYCVASPIED